MKVLVIGRSGQLATELVRCAWPDGTRVSALGRPQLDVTNLSAVAEVVARICPSVLINAAAYTAVDRAEAEPDAAMMVNHLGACNLAETAGRNNLPLIHISTNYVFDGRGERPWCEDDATTPLGSYGRSKLAGEQAIRERHPMHVILRTSWLFAAHGQNFVRTVLRLGAERSSVGIVNDQLGCPTAAADLARVIMEITAALQQNGATFGVYHYAGRDPVTWYGFAKEIFENASFVTSPELRPITTSEFGARAPRPAYSVLDCTKIERAFGIRQKPWLDDLRAVLNELRNRPSDVIASAASGVL